MDLSEEVTNRQDTKRESSLIESLQKAFPKHKLVPKDFKLDVESNLAQEGCGTFVTSVRSLVHGFIERGFTLEEHLLAPNNDTEMPIFIIGLRTKSGESVIPKIHLREERSSDAVDPNAKKEKKLGVGTEYEAVMEENGKTFYDNMQVVANKENQALVVLQSSTVNLFSSVASPFDYSVIFDDKTFNECLLSLDSSYGYNYLRDEVIAPYFDKSLREKGKFPDELNIDIAIEKEDPKLVKAVVSSFTISSFSEDIYLDRSDDFPFVTVV